MQGLAALPSRDGRGVLAPLDGGAPVEVPDLVAAIASWEERHAPRWVWPSTADLYPRLLERGLRVERCYDMELAEAILLGVEGRWGEPRSLASTAARLHGEPVPPDPPPRSLLGDAEATLFSMDTPAPALSTLLEVYEHQRARCAAAPSAGRLNTLIAAESAGALVAAEMGHAGLPWRADVHRALLLDLLGEPSPMGGPPRKLVDLAERINEAFGSTTRVHPDSPAEVLRAFERLGITLANTRAWELRRIDHPVVPILIEYKELARIWSAHGWSWLDQWVKDGRFRPEYIPGGVVSGRWATRGGGALQIPKVVRKAVVADPGWALVVADAGQLEPRVLAAVSGDRRLASAAAAGDLYAALALEAFGGDRARAKVALLGAMYGQTGGQAVPALAALRRFYPTAWDYVEQAARTGETGGLVHTWLGRTCPPASVTFIASGYEEGGSRSRARGRFTRNFVIQGTAAEWALVLLARLRAALVGTAAELVFFQHDEVVVHCPAGDAELVIEAVHRAGDEARQLLFGDTPVRFPLDVSVVECYADAK